ncbi:M20/M25/M40 family metallo-hydrolase [Olivibacter sp. CPCC 100613]|uniref:M20/M25/M40 family metallo-hydrolase n=1 Tax=Olivibacter sp. CPCC 100613 TaxID=3079931 RepID=UPI002FF7F213
MNLTKNVWKVFLVASLFTWSISLGKAKQEKPIDSLAQEKYVKEIAKLVDNKKVKQAFECINSLEPETKSNHILLTEIPAPPFKEKLRGEKFAKMLKAAGADSVWVDAEGNVIAKRNGTNGKRTILIEGHLDTVFPEGTDVKVVTRGDTLAAPGIGDDTRALAVLLTLLKAMNKANIQTSADVLIAGTVGEEGQGDLRGMKRLFGKDGLKIDTHIALDGTSTDRIVNRGVGSHRYHIRYKSDGGHSYGSFGMVNTHVALGKAIAYWSEDADAYIAQPGPKTTYSVSVIGGGTSVNSIPFEAWMEVDMRSESDERLQKVDDYLQTALQKALKEVNSTKKFGKDLTLEVKMMGDRPSGTSELTQPLTQRMMSIIQRSGQKPKLGASSTNANVPLSLKIPSITIGSGGAAGGAHSLGEWFVNSNGQVGIQNALLILLAEAGLE